MVHFLNPAGSLSYMLSGCLHRLPPHVRIHTLSLPHCFYYKLGACEHTCGLLALLLEFLMVSAFSAQRSRKSCHVTVETISERCTSSKTEQRERHVVVGRSDVRAEDLWMLDEVRSASLDLSWPHRVFFSSLVVANTSAVFYTGGQSFSLCAGAEVCPW